MFSSSNDLTLSMYSHYLHLDFIKEVLEVPLKQEGPLMIGNNLNTYFNFEKIEAYANTLKKQGTDRQQKSSKDVFTGALAEETLIYLLENFFSHNRLNYELINNKEDPSFMKIFKIVNEKLSHEKIFDVDIAIKNKKIDNKYFLLSCKGTSRERIGQFLSNLFLMDDRLIKTKYNDRYYLDFNKKDIIIKYGFVCYDWAKTKDFIKYNPSGKLRKTLKQTEVLLINDDTYIGGGVTVLNNLENLEGVINFGILATKIIHFLN